MTSHHRFTKLEVQTIRDVLLKWYDNNKRSLPWRDRASASNLESNERAYAVWVSEIMLQQTQVATVVEYYKRWMEKWPTVEDLSKASLEEVNEMWSGLGYYSRGRRLLEGAQKVVLKLNGRIPLTAKELMKELPGVGKYTAGAIASIAHQQVTGVVDGNVIRVFARLRRIGGNVASQETIDFLWETANSLVDEARPGDFNQALMELGATVCTPRQPTCQKCPVQSCCLAQQEVNTNSDRKKEEFTSAKSATDVIEIEDTCKFCLSSQSDYDSRLGVMNYPQKVKKKAVKEENYSMAIVVCGGDSAEEYLLTKRPKTGLLANMWELPNVARDADIKVAKEKQTVLDHLAGEYQVDPDAVASAKCLGQVTHMFSHIHHHYTVWKVHLRERSSAENCGTVKWLSKKDLLASGITKTVRKCLNLLDENADNVPAKSSNKRKSSDVSVDKRQKTLDSMFTRSRRIQPE